MYANEAFFKLILIGAPEWDERAGIFKSSLRLKLSDLYGFEGLFDKFMQMKLV